MWPELPQGLEREFELHHLQACAFEGSNSSTVTLETYRTTWQCRGNEFSIKTDCVRAIEQLFYTILCYQTLIEISRACDKISFLFKIE